MPKHPALATADAVRRYVREQLRDAVTDPSHGWHWPALTTGPESRVVVLRDVGDGGALLTWFTDRRSAKVARLQANPDTGLLFYHAAHRTQLRLRGPSGEVTDEGERERRWAKVSPGAKANYATVQAPGTPLPQAARDLPDGWPALSPARERDAFAHFAVYRTRVAAGDFLQLLDAGAYRSKWDSRQFTFVTP